MMALIDELISKGKDLRETIISHDVPKNVVGMGRNYYTINSPIEYWTWTKRCIMTLRQLGLENEATEFKNFADDKANFRIIKNYEQMMSTLYAVKEFLEYSQGDKCYIIAYDLRKPGRNYDGLYETIKSFGTWGKLTESVWAIVTSKDCVEIRDRLLTFLDDNDRLLVVRSGQESAWARLIASSEWVQECIVK